MPNKPTLPDAPEVATPPAAFDAATILGTDNAPKISEAGALENSPEFIQAAKEAWGAIQNGNTAEETGFAVGPDGKPGKMMRASDQANGNGHISASIPSNSVAMLHSHNNRLEAKPSQDDIDTAKKWKRPMYVMHRNGLDHIDATGQVTRVKNGTSWLYAKPKAAVKDSGSKSSDSKKTTLEVHGDALKSGRNSQYRRAFIARGNAGKHNWK
jgi:hypothetical protein